MRKVMTWQHSSKNQAGCLSSNKIKKRFIRKCSLSILDVYMTYIYSLDVYIVVEAQKKQNLKFFTFFGQIVLL